MARTLLFLAFRLGTMATFLPPGIFVCVVVDIGKFTSASSVLADPATYVEPDDAEYWRGEGDLPFEAPRYTDLTREKFDELILDGKIFIVPGMADDWPMREWDCDFFRNDPEFKKAAMNHQYAERAGGETKLGDDWKTDLTPSGAKNETAPQIAPFYWGIKDVQYEQRTGWKKSMLKRVAKSFKVPSFMDPTKTADSFRRTPEFWFGAKGAGAKAHMDSHIQATVSVQISGTKRWRLMPLRKRRAPFIGMMYQDGKPYENPEGWQPIFSIELKQGESLFFGPGIIHETLNIDESAACASSVTFQFDAPFAARFYRRFFPRVRQTADIHESWVVIRQWARLGMPGDRQGHGAPYEEARKSSEVGKHFKKLDKNGDGLLSLAEIQNVKEWLEQSGPSNALAWHDVSGDGVVSMEEFREGFAFWSGITHQAIERTPKDLRKFQLHGTIENLEDLPPKLAKKSLKHGLAEEARFLAAVAGKSAEL